MFAKSQRTGMHLHENGVREWSARMECKNNGTGHSGLSQGCLSKLVCPYQRSKVVTSLSGQKLIASEKLRPREKKNDLITIQPSWPRQEQKYDCQDMGVFRGLQRQPANRGLVSFCTHHDAIVFLMTSFSYSLFHTSRKTFSNVKVNISTNGLPSA
ncbi:hypothetical protein HGM15179_017138 [Zosterops borbonicus]|uniref:Uncharacterized protein n=1 Tax=Zosterops borbonicus TaxID=364589 RepID=A0A8K1G1L0_9PASS|nr:hypothetical protein HGM15179_017138 [Zosterops borbonicus]